MGRTSSVGVPMVSSIVGVPMVSGIVGVTVIAAMRVTVRRVVVRMLMIMTMSGMLSITVIWCLVDLGRFQISKGVVIVMVVVVIAAVRVTVVGSAVLENENANEIHKEPHY